MQPQDIDDLYRDANDLIYRARRGRVQPPDAAPLLARLRDMLLDTTVHNHALLRLRWLRVGIITHLSYKDHDGVRGELLTAAVRDLTHLIRAVAAASLGGMPQPEGIDLAAVAAQLQEVLTFSGFSPVEGFVDLARDVEGALAYCEKTDRLSRASLADCYLATASAVAAQQRLTNLRLAQQEVIGDRFAFADEAAGEYAGYGESLLGKAWLADPLTPDPPTGLRFGSA